ncbi:MAG: M1 family metallopeptidase [Planctomycetes bacterium]|nr:M1 family metallopeptidase [Planctomycetota bacterium]
MRFIASCASALTLLFSLLLSSTAGFAHDPFDENPPPFLVVDKLEREDPFRQLDDVLPSPNESRLASGAPGPAYWQQQVDMEIDVTLDAVNHRLDGLEKVTYHNNSPHTLTYLWMQLDQNRFREESIGNRSRSIDPEDEQSIRWLRRLAFQQNFDGGFKIESIVDAEGNPVPFILHDTLLRIDLPQPLAPGESYSYSLKWHHNIVNAKLLRARGGYEWFEDAGNAIYEMAQWFPRMCAYTDYAGWQNKQFIGSGEFTLEFGDYIVRITVPDTFVVTATGELTNPEEVMTDTQMQRMKASETAEKPMFVITPEEALANEKKEATGTRTWVFDAKKVRDFAWAASPKFIWDSLGVDVPGGDRTMAMSFYPNEGEPLWSKYSTHAIAHTLEEFSRMCTPYPYPVAISVNGPVGGMEYPMICFNGPRPEEDGTYSERTKYGLIGVIIHEVGHNWFPMIINSDERQWTWMDEGLNTFVQFVTQLSWEEKYPSRRGEARNITRFMSSPNQMPIMTNSEQLIQFGNNAYAKPATALNILRESIMGRELFDFAFRQYCERWEFRRPEPADLFRTLEDASGMDLDWFWRGWFYTTDHADLAIESVVRYHMDSGNPDVEKPLQKAERDSDPEWISRINNKDIPFRSDRFPELLDFYNSFDEFDVTEEDRRGYESFLARLDAGDEDLLNRDWNFTIVRLRNYGGLVMPVPVRLTYSSGKTEEQHLPAELWRSNPRVISRLMVTPEPVVKVEIDPHWEIADADRSNNSYPQEIDQKRFRIRPDSDRTNPMQRDRDERLMREAEIAAQRLGKEIARRVASKTAGTPMPAASGVLAEMQQSLFSDPFGSEFSVFDVKDGEGIAKIFSAGPDGNPGTDDDLTWVVFKDGHVDRWVDGN